MTAIINIINQGDFCSLLPLIAILAIVGSRMVGPQETLFVWGWRLAAVAFIGYCVYGGTVLQPVNAQDWLGIVLRGLLAGGIALGPSWILLATFAFGQRHLFAAPARQVASRVNSSRDRRREREDLAERRRREQLQWEHEAEMRTHQHQQHEAQLDAQRQRTDARADAELTFSLFAPKIRDRFPKEAFEDYLAKYMGDDHSPEDVRRRGQELIATLQRHAGDLESPEEKRSMEDLAHWFQEQKELIEALPLDDKVKRQHTAELTRRYAELSSKLLESLEP